VLREVEHSLSQVLSTSLGERVLQPEFGCGFKYIPELTESKQLG